MIGWNWALLASRAASSEITVIGDQCKAKAELLLVMLTAVPQENSVQPLVFQVTVFSVPLKVLCGVQWPVPKTVGLHLTAQVMRIRRGSVTATPTSQRPTRLTWLQGAWSMLVHSLKKSCFNDSDSDALIWSRPCNA